MESSVIEVEDVNAWHRVVSERLMPLAIDSSANPDFKASVTAQAFAGVRLARVRAGKHAAERTHRLAAGGDPHYWLALQIAGSSTISQAGRTAELAPGELAVYDSSMPYRREFPGDSDTLVVLIPQQLISLPPQALALIAGLRIGADEGMGAILSAYLSSLAAHLHELKDGQGASTVHALLELVTAVFSEQFGLVAPHRSARRLDEVMRIRAWIMDRLGDPTLDPAGIAAAHFISTRQLHVLFHEQGSSVGTWVRERRLDAARRDLQTPGEDSGIAAIAERWGFGDPAHFARAFKRAYGVSPRAFRDASRKEHPAS
ncbi:AraC-like ligand-binding domain-containing protein [Galactobacter valiniphilus]|uniref:AraC-like ligand-binding domain-containing protein n=1 Tax=Galactobacter valiniphilus TaxID=2676122 RepID=UPI0013147A9E|nr:helix-turn-helix domain-containing protein [Galactobacter valiniphilus]